MTPQLHTFGQSQSRVVVIDGFSGAPEAVVAIAAAMAPFPREGATQYPGVRRFITEAHPTAYGYAMHMLRALGPFVGNAFGFKGCHPIEASFSMVTTPPEALSPPQRAPHFDSPDPNLLAVLHFLSDTPNTGTAFYRHKATGIERVEPGNAATLRAAVAREAAPEGYVTGSNAEYEEIGRVEAVPDRLVIYQGALLHSGLIPPDMVFSDDPARGRLTANLFIRGI